MSTHHGARTRPDVWVYEPRPHDCPACRGFQYEQLAPGRFSVCRSCLGSGRDDVAGDRPAGLVVRDSSAAEPAVFLGLPADARRHHGHRARLVRAATEREEVPMARSDAGAERERERKRQAAARRREREREAREATRKLGDAMADGHEPVVAEAEVVESLPAIVGELTRHTSAAAARAERAAADLAGPAGLAANDLWRHEAEVQRAIADLQAVIQRSRAWRASREAEVAT